MQIFTLTLNPALDVHCTGEHFAAGHENFADILSEEAGGKGINLTRALRAGGMDAGAYVLLGEDNAPRWLSLLGDDCPGLVTLSLPGRIRENFTLHIPGEKETRLSFRGFQADDSLPERVAAVLLPRFSPGDILTFTGSLPPGISHGATMAFLEKFRHAGVELVIDSKSLSPADLCRLSPLLIKPNEEEAAVFGLSPEADEEELCGVFLPLVKEKGLQNILLTLGPGEAWLFTSTGVWRASPPPLKPVSTIGAGDSSIAGFLTAYARGESPEECLRTAVSFGSAACLTPGTRPPRPEDIARLREEIIPRRYR